jgi:hypothetical protein
MNVRFFPLIAALFFLAGAPGVNAADISVNTAAFPPTAGRVTGGGPVAIGSDVTLMAIPASDCDNFVDWTVGGVKVSADNPYNFTATKTETVVAEFAPVEYAIVTGTFPAGSGIVTGGGKKGCGSTVTLKAFGKPGYAFENWTSEGVQVSSSATYSFIVSGDSNLVANFKDDVPPVVKMTTPTANEKIPAAAWPLEGTATDKAGVVAVYYNLNGTGWVEASTVNGYSSWYAWVTLNPDSANTVSVYAVDSLGNSNTPVTTKFVCTAAGLAPVSIAGNQAGVTEGTNTVNRAVVSYDLAGYVRFSVLTNEGGEVGTYTYTPTGPNTAELVQHRVFPTANSSADGTVLELTFTNAFDATNSGADGGTLSFGLAPNIVPATLEAAQIVSKSFVNTNFVATNLFGASTFTLTDNSGDTSSGTYTFTKFSSVGALVVETVTSPPSLVGTTNYIALSLSDSGPPITGYYNYQTLGLGNNEAPDDGTFVLTAGTDDTKFVGPVTLSGLKSIVTPNGEPSFTRTFGNGTFASLSLKSATEPTDVGINLANTRVSSDTGTDRFFSLGPPYILGLDDGTSDATFTSSEAARYTDGGVSGTITYSKLATNVPAAVTGYSLTATQTGRGHVSLVKFSYNTFTSAGDVVGVGTYTYAPYSPAMALVQFNFTTGTDAGITAYVMLDFTSKAGGPFGSAKPVGGGWEFALGEFVLTKTP